MNLATITPASLPPQVYAHNPEHDVALTADPAHFRPIRCQDFGGWVKPAPGSGLWTAPVTAWTQDRRPADSAWLEYLREEMETDTSDLLLTEVFPTAEAWILLIDCQEHLASIVTAYPADPGGLAYLDRAYPDWAGLAEAGWDGVYLTDRGQWATRLPKSGPDLYSWDLESLLWLRPAYMTGQTVRSAARSKAGAA
jgi:hypothetical protein